MKNRQIRAYAGAFLSFSLLCDFAKVSEICKKFASNEDEENFLISISIILSKLRLEFNDHPDDLDKISKLHGLNNSLNLSIKNLENL